VVVLFQGRFRTTEDIDVIILHKELNIEEFGNFCKKNELSIESFELKEGFKEHSHISIFDLPNAIRIDCKGAYTQCDRECIKDPEQYNYEGVLIRVASPEYIIINRLYKGGQIDYEDAFSVYLHNRDRIDEEKLRKYSKILKIENLLQDFLIRAENISNINE